MSTDENAVHVAAIGSRGNAGLFKGMLNLMMLMSCVSLLVFFNWFLKETMDYSEAWKPPQNEPTYFKYITEIQKHDYITSMSC